MRTILLTLALVASTAAFAQNNQPTHQHETAGIIDGKDHPELIPDLTAYKMFFVTSGQLPTATPNELAIQQGRVQNKLQFSTGDAIKFILVTNEFRIHYERLVADHNKRADDAFAASQKPADDNIEGEIANLTAATVGKLQSVLSPEAAARLAAVVTAEKAHMKVMPYAK